MYFPPVFWQGLNEENNNQTSKLLPYLPALMLFLEVKIYAVGYLRGG